MASDDPLEPAPQPKPDELSRDLKETVRQATRRAGTLRSLKEVADLGRRTVRERPKSA